MIVVESKKCKLCGVEKSAENFYTHKYTADGLRPCCKECTRIQTEKWRKNNKEKIAVARKRRWDSDPEKHRAYLREYRKKNPQVLKKYYEANKEECYRRCRESEKKKPEKYREMYRSALNKRNATVRGRIDTRMASSIRGALGKRKHGRKWQDLVGYTTDMLREHLEERFTAGMSWEKFKNGEIHIDHKIPKSIFNYESTKDIDFKRCWGLDNLQPMWAEDNLKKRDKIDRPFQPSLQIS